MTAVRFIYCIILILLAGTVSTASALTSEELKSIGLDVVHTSQAHPFYYMGPHGEPKGMVVDFWNKWSEETGIEVNFGIAPWKKTLTKVLDGSYDVHAGLMKTPERQAQFDFSNPLFTIATALIARQGENYEKNSLLQNETIGVVAGGYPGMFLRTQHPKTGIKEYDTPKQVIDALAEWEVGGAVMDVPTFHFNNIQRQTPVAYEVVSVLTEQPIYAGVRKGDTELLAAINIGLGEIDERERRHIQERWFVIQPEEERTDIKLYLLGGMIVLLGVAYLIFRATNASRN